MSVPCEGRVEDTRHRETPPLDPRPFSGRPTTDPTSSGGTDETRPVRTPVGGICVDGRLWVSLHLISFIHPSRCVLRPLWGTDPST